MTEQEFTETINTLKQIIDEAADKLAERGVTTSGKPYKFMPTTGQLNALGFVGDWDKIGVQIMDLTYLATEAQND